MSADSRALLFTSAQAAERLLSAIDGVRPQSAAAYSPCYDYTHVPRAYLAGGSRSGHDPQDWGRTWLRNGGCTYIDLGHLEVCIPEVLSAREHTAAWNAMLCIAREAQVCANAQLPDGEWFQVLANSSDGQGHSYGSHLNFLVTRELYENVFDRRVHYAAALASFEASSAAITGQGKASAEDSVPHAGYQLSQRVDFVETLIGPQTTHKRPMVNSRDEALCGAAGMDRRDMARIHCIFYDSNLCQWAHFLKVGMLQLVLLGMEQGRVSSGSLLEDPIAAARTWSRDPTLTAKAPLADGRQVTVLEMQAVFLEGATRLVESGNADGLVPEAPLIIEMWADTLEKLRTGDMAGLAARLDWVLKLQSLLAAMESRPELTWDSPEVKHLDQIYASLDPEDGLYLAYESAGLVEHIVTEEEVAHLTRFPPENTRAWTRGSLIATAPDAIVSVDWDRIRFRFRGRNLWSTYRWVDLPDPLSHTREQELQAVDGQRIPVTNEPARESAEPPDEALRQRQPVC